MIRDQLPGHVSLVDEFAHLLEISNGSTFRRIRGEKPIVLNEVQKLAGMLIASNSLIPYT